jgi:hypothetical protein
MLQILDLYPSENKSRSSRIFVECGMFPTHIEVGPCFGFWGGPRGLNRVGKFNPSGIAEIFSLMEPWRRALYVNDVGS